MPGMLDTVLDVGLTATSAAGLADEVGPAVADEGRIDVDEAIARVSPAQLDLASRPRVDAVAAGEPLAVGTGACPGVVSGRVCFASDRVDAVGADGEPVALVRPETSPNDLAGMLLASGLLTRRGGLVSHAALVARELDLPAVVGVEAVDDKHVIRFRRWRDTVARRFG
jgi:pyruvate,orthophosphate dikinase